MKNLLAIAVIVGSCLSASAATQTESTSDGRFLMDEDSPVALSNEGKDAITIHVFHKKADGVRCGLKLVGEGAVGDQTAMASVADRLVVRQDGEPLSILRRSEGKGVEYEFSRAILFLSRVEISTKSGKSLRDELKHVLGKDDARVFVAAKDCDQSEQGPAVRLASMLKR